MKRLFGLLLVIYSLTLLPRLASAAEYSCFDADGGKGKYHFTELGNQAAPAFFWGENELGDGAWYSLNDRVYISVEPLNCPVCFRYILETIMNGGEGDTMPPYSIFQKFEIASDLNAREWIRREGTERWTANGDYECRLGEP